MSVGVVICAAGKGLRANLNKNKLFAPLQGETVIERTLSAFAFEGIDQIVVAVAKDEQEEMRTLCAPFGAQIVVGGATRAQSVYNALQAINTDMVLIHDGARPFVSREIIQNCIDSVKTHRSGICAIPCTDTMAVKSTTNEIIRIPDRELLVRIQTPQGFYTKDILNAYQQAFETGKLYSLSHHDKQETVCTRTATQYTDDSSVYLDFIGVPALCEGDIENKKLTYEQDFKTAVRCGFGVDTHAFGKQQNFVTLCGVQIPHDSGLIAHSDGDVAIHALMDALLSAAGLNDIGHYFPDSDEKYKDASSVELLKTVLSLLQENGFAPQNISLAIQAEKPRLSPHIEHMKQTLASTMGISKRDIGISAGTCEGLGFVGAGKGITVNAFVLIKEI